MKVEVFVGIDVSKDRLDVQVRPLPEAFAVKRDDGGLEELIARLRDIGPVLVVLEATGGDETVVAGALVAAGLPLAVVNPRRIREFAKAEGGVQRIRKRLPTRQDLLTRRYASVSPSAATQLMV